MELSNLAAKGEVKSSSRLHTKDPVLFRVGGRLRHAPETLDSKHPIVFITIDGNHPMTKLIMSEYHHVCTSASELVDRFKKANGRSSDGTLLLYFFVSELTIVDFSIFDKDLVPYR